ncbi:MAG: DUF6786 family protein [Planctomycetota bacterium]
MNSNPYQYQLKDRLWIGPEAGAFGFFFDAGMQQSAVNWRVPQDLRDGYFDISRAVDQPTELTKRIRVRNIQNVEFDMEVAREVRRIDSAGVAEWLGFPLENELFCCATESINTLKNCGTSRWKKESGLPHLWVLGQFTTGRRCWVAAPFTRNAAKNDTTPIYNDLYFGKIPPDRIRIHNNTVFMLADGTKVTKFGLSPLRSTGRAGAFDPDLGMLTIVGFDIDRGAVYANNLWENNMIGTGPSAGAFGGDVFQTYNSGDSSFFELESVSPVRELEPEELLIHKHQTYLFQGSAAALSRISISALGVDVVDAFRSHPAIHSS